MPAIFAAMRIGLGRAITGWSWFELLLVAAGWGVCLGVLRSHAVDLVLATIIAVVIEALALLAAMRAVEEGWLVGLPTSRSARTLRANPMIRVRASVSSSAAAIIETWAARAERIDLEVRDNESITVIGPSGCGKTTLLRIIAGLIPYGRGEITIDRKPVTGPGPARAVVFQNFALMPWADVLANVTFGLEIRGTPK